MWAFWPRGTLCWLFGKVICLKFSLHCSDSRLSRERERSGNSAKNNETELLQIWNCPRGLWASDSELRVRGISPMGRVYQLQIKEIYCCHLQLSSSLDKSYFLPTLSLYDFFKILPAALLAGCVFFLGKSRALKKCLERPLFGERHILKVIW